MSGKFWVIEGCDGAGKGTQAKMLVDRLRGSSLLNSNSVYHWSFPNYKIEPFGPIIRDYLDGKFGDASNTNPYFISTLFAFDRWQESPRMKSLLKHNDWIVCDRYVESNMGFQATKIADVKEREKFVVWLYDLEYNRLQLPKPSGVILLSLPPEISIKRTNARRKLEKNGRGKVAKIDIHEQDDGVVGRSYEQYHSLAHKYKWHLIDCYQDNRELTREEISDNIWEIVSNNEKQITKTFHF